ncbi:MAG: carbohydrate ABC transporter permease [Bacillota bacterium]
MAQPITETHGSDLRRRFEKSKFQGLVWAIARTLLLLGMAFIIVSPLLVKISGSFMSLEDVYDSSVGWIPRRPTLEHYRVVFQFMNYPRSLLLTTLLVTAVSLLQVISCTFIGYGLARYDFPFKGLVFGCVLFTLVVPPQLLLVPLYINFRYFGAFGMGPGVNLLNTPLPFLLMAGTGTGIKNGLFIYIMRQYFKGMPRSLEEAAHVDGAGPFRTFFSIMLPAAQAPLLVIFVLSFAWQWNDYFYTTTIFQAKNDLLVHRYLGVVQDYMLAFREEHGFDAPFEMSTMILNTASLYYIVPLLALFGFLQGRFIAGSERTGLVG